MTPFLRTSSLALLGVGFLFVGCKQEAPPPPAAVEAPKPPPAPTFGVSGIQLGKALGADKHVVQEMGLFGRRDTIYVSVLTQGTSDSAVVAANWTFQTGPAVAINSARETIKPTGPAATAFHIAKKTPWPVGKYKVEISLNGTSAGSKEFEVK